MESRSLWQATSQPLGLPALRGEVTADVVIVGGGITGITTAMLISQTGASAVVLEAHEVGGGTTGHSTGNLYAVVGNGLSAVMKKWGADTMKAVARSRAAAVDFIEETVHRHGLDCDFTRCHFHQFAPGMEDATRKALEDECEAAVLAGLPAHMAESTVLPFHTGHVFVLEDQANFHPLNYVRGLAEAVASEKCRIFERSEVLEIDYDGCTVKTADGAVSAKVIVMATHTPKGFDFVQTELGPYREYVVAATLGSGAYPHGIYWSQESIHHSIRALRHGGREWLIVAGHKHKTGQESDALGCFEELDAYVRSSFDVESIDYRWSAQGYYPADGLPYIGRSGTHKNLYLATGFLADGLTWGTVAAHVLAVEMLGAPEGFANLFKPGRLRPTRAAKGFLKENLNVAAEYVKDYASLPKAKGADDIPAGEGRVVEMDGKRCAVHRDANGALTAVSPICTHLKCIVHWNNAEKSWDCPCHGSRFAIDGTVLEGPAAKPLERIPLA